MVPSRLSITYVTSDLCLPRGEGRGDGVGATATMSAKVVVTRTTTIGAVNGMVATVAIQKPQPISDQI